MAEPERKTITLLRETAALLERVKPGLLLGRWQLSERIGVGGSAVVFRARDRRGGPDAAVKILVTPEDDDRRELLARFDLQAAMLTTIRHEAVLPIRQVGCQDDLCYLVMDLVLGPEGDPVTLADYAAWFGGLIEPRELLALFRLILSAFIHVHLHKVVHGNLKPRNVVLDCVRLQGATWEASVRITDFGLTRILGTDFVLDSVRKSVRQTEASVATAGGAPAVDARALIETYDYMSPEQRRGQGASRRSDVFTLGLMFLHLLTGRKIIGFEPPSRVVPGLTPAWDSFILRATAQERRQRFANVAEMLDALEALTCEDAHARRR